MDNANVQNLERAAAWLEGQNRALELIARGASLDEILGYLVRFIEAEAPDLVCSVLLLENGRLYHGAAPSLPDEFRAAIEGLAIGPDVGSCGSAAFLGRPVVSADIASDPRWPAPDRDRALRHGLRACWSTPILASSGAVLGTFAIYYHEPSEPRPTDLRLVQVATHLAGIAVTHHRTEEALRLRAKELVESDRRKDEFLAMLAHELRNPLAPVLTALSLMRARSGDAAAVERYRQVIQRQAQHLARLVDDLLDVSRITRGTITLDARRTTAAEVVAGAVEVARPVIEQRRHQLSIDLPEAPIELHVDPVRMAQVLANLLVNAAKYTPPGGRIGVRAAARAGEAVLSVEDSGIGIDREMLSRVFDLFTQANPSLDRAQGGLGIGLTVARRLVELQGGRLTAQSAGLGEGSEFTVRLPLPSAAAMRESEVDGAPAPDTRSRRVLVVDDNADAADLLSAALEDAGHSVRVARDGHAALAVAAEWQPDVVLLDIGLPGLDGYEVATRLRAAHGTALRIVALTGYGRDSDRARSAAAGIDLHLVKPIDVDTVLAATRGVAQADRPRRGGG